MTSIYQIDSQIIEFLNNNIDPDTGELLNVSEFEALELSRKEKQKNIILYYKNLQGEGSIIKSEIDRLKYLQSLNIKKQDYMTNLLALSMRSKGEFELDFTICKAKFKKNPPSLVVEKDADVSAYTTTKTTEHIDKAAIKKAIKRGEEIKGCRLESGERLDII
jgi:hypothetical protein